MNSLSKLEAVFFAALEKGPGQDRTAFLDNECSGDPDLRQRVEKMLAAQANAGSFLESPAADRPPLGNDGLTTDRTSETEVPPSPESEMPLDFLRPSEQPGHLGRVGHYEVLEVVGRGGMGIVLRASDEKLHRVVAIKVMAPQLATSAAARKRFIREAQAAAAVSHDHVVTIHAVEEADGLPYLAMQYVSGLSLQQRLDKSGSLEIREIVRIGMQTAAGLAAAHAQGLIHRDIKPANILLENGVERVKITDFGLARAVADASMTQTGMVAGTPQYMSPKQARGETVDRRSDLFSLGSVLYAMCTGRPPFRADSGMAVLKRVCDDTPRPIRETNPDMPEWLEAIIAKLHAKDPGQRYQSAAEVAELLNEHLAHLQHPSVVPLPAVEKPAKHVPVRRRLWATAAAVLLCAVAGLGLTEAAGVTKLTASVIRVFTPEGTLVVEVDDPNVKVTIEGDGGLIITGAGPQEVHLHPGIYKVRATKDGKPVREEELITITRGDKRVVKVSLAAEPVGAAPVTGQPETQAFVLLGGQGVAGRQFDTLADAVRGASDGDTIEVRGNGPFISEPISIQRTALTIRAGVGFRPVIKLDPKALPRNLPLVRTNSALVLEGLELHQSIPEDQNLRGWRQVVQANEGSLWAANCRFRTGVWVQAPVCVLRNCEVVAEEGALSVQPCPFGTRLLVDNCLHRTNGSAIYIDYSENLTPYDASIQIQRTTFVGRNAGLLWLALRSLSSAATDEPQTVPRIRVEITDSILDTPCVLGFGQTREFIEKAVLLQPAEAEATLLRLLQWRGERNLFAAGSASVGWFAADLPKQPPRGPQSLGNWKEFWGSPETDSLEGRLRFQGGNPLSRADLDQLTPEDFRLRADSAGYRAGADGKDLGADVDLVGPGPAYERWKKTPEYQEWLKDTGQRRERATAKPEPGAFVLLGGQGVAERKFDMLADAVQGASDGDNIEIRGNGPFVTRPVKIGNGALAIRAAAGYRPVIRLSPEGGQTYALLHSSAPLTVEGLEFQWLGQQAGKPGQPAANIIFATGNSLHVANRRFRTDNPDPNQPYRVCCIAAYTPACCVRNCEFFTPFQRSVSINTSSRSFVLDNCLHLGRRVALSLVYESTGGVAEFVLSRNTLVTDSCQAIFLGVGSELEQLQQSPAAKPIGLEATGNIFDTNKVLQFGEMRSRPMPLELDEAESTFRRVLAWNGRENVYRAGRHFSLGWSYHDEARPSHGPMDLEGWKQFWNSPETGSVEDRVRYQGGDLLARLADGTEKLTPEDFRLRADSAGYRAGPDGKDLGAHVDLVGPGPAYERWKKTPEYERWLVETAQKK